MNQEAVIKNITYHLLETVPSLTGQEQFVMCEDENGGKFVCPEDIWLRHAPESEALAPVHAGSTPLEKINFFLSLFRGRDNLYAKRYYNLKTGRSGYVPACQNEWLPGVCDKKAHRCPECPNRAFKPLTAQTVRAHLIGRDEFCRDVAGIYPLLEDDRTWLLAVDFDGDAWQEDILAFCEACVSCGVTPAIERSRSGNGAHVWFFFSEPVAAAEARRLGSGLLTQAMARRHELRFQSYDRLFPSQDTMPKGGFGNLIALPFQGQAQRDGNTLFVDEHFIPYADQWAFLSTLHKITPRELTEYLVRLCDSGDMGVMLESTEQKPWPAKPGRQKLSREDFPVLCSLCLKGMRKT